MGSKQSSFIKAPVKREHSLLIRQMFRNKTKKLPKRGGELTETDFKFFEIQTHMTRDEIQVIFDKFKKTNPNGKLNRYDFIKLYKSFRTEPSEVLDKISEQIFRCFDWNCNGYIEFNEFLISYVLTSRGDLRKRLEYAFWLYDRDRNGYLDYDEIESIIYCMSFLYGFDKSTYEIEDIANICIKDLDVSNDGRISNSEFIDGLTKNEVLRKIMSPFN